VLRPTKAKTFIPEVAIQTDVPEEAVNAIINFYWQEVRKSLSGLKHSRVHLTNLGDFVTKHWKLDDKIDRLERFEENNRQKGLQQMTARFKTVETLYDLKALKAIIEEEKQRAEFIKLHKKTANVTKREHNTDMEE
jgi:uncharacterized protein YdcH (DUF465 family)